jgi:hypothetical protein
MPPSGPGVVPVEAEGLLASEDFVAERDRLAKELRAAGRREEADAVARLRKPPKIVVAVNRAARDAPLHAHAAAAAAERLVEAQAAGDRPASDDALARLGKAVEELVDRAAGSGGDRVAIATVVRAALTSAAGRSQLVHGQLADTPEPTGFEVFSGLRITARNAPAPAAARRHEGGEKRARADARREQLERELAEATTELRRASDELGDAERVEAEARRAREAAERRHETIRRKVERARQRLS